MFDYTLDILLSLEKRTYTVLLKSVKDVILCDLFVKDES